MTSVTIDEALFRAIRAQARTLGFESPTAGAVALRRLAFGMPPSETHARLPVPQAAMETIRRTILHFHVAEGGLHPNGNGSWARFSRHVSEGDARWDFEVEVVVDGAGAMVIGGVKAVRPGDDEPDGDGESAAERRAPLTDADLLPFGMIACPCCGHATLAARGTYQICPVCFWEDDGQDDGDADAVRGGPNRVSLADGRRNFSAYGASDDASRAQVRRPTREEVRLRRFG